jgi:type III restriction enzyme
MVKSIIKYDTEIPQIEGHMPDEKPESYLSKEGDKTNVVTGRRPSKMFLVDSLRKDIDKWRDEGYPRVSDTTKDLLNFWFEQDHLLNKERFWYYFGQREAVETLIFLVENKGFTDLSQVIKSYSHTFSEWFGYKPDIYTNPDGNRFLKRYFPELKQEGNQELPEENLLRYAFKMATGSGKTIVMDLIIVWSYFHKLRVNGSKMADNFLIVAPNVIVFERLETDFSSGKIFHKYPLIPPAWKNDWKVKVIIRGATSTPVPSGNLFLTNIQQIYESREQQWTPQNALDAILGRKPQKDLSKAPITVLTHLKNLDNLMVLNDEAHHVHDDELEWNKTLLMLHHTISGGLTLWLDFSATPKNQNGTYFPWIIVDYPLAQAVEDRIVKAPLIVHRIDKKDPANVVKGRLAQAYGDWITAALERWREHYRVYSAVGKKPVLFIMAEKNAYADEIANIIRKEPDIKPEEVLLIHTDDTGEIKKSDLEEVREVARKIDGKENIIKVVVSVLMLREGWDVQNVTVILGLRPFTSKAEILPEQGVGRGLRLMRGISPDNMQTLEVMGTAAFEDFVRQLEKEGVGIKTVTTPPPLPVIITPVKSKLEYDINIPTTELTYSHNFAKLSEIDPMSISPLFPSMPSEEEIIKLRMEFATTRTEVHQTQIKPSYIPLGEEIISSITNRILKEVKLTDNYFNILYPTVKAYISQRCFQSSIDLDDEKIRSKLRDIAIHNLIISHLSKVVGNATVMKNEIKLQSSMIVLSKTKEFTWRRKNIKCDRTVFNLVAVFNDFEANFAAFLDKSKEIIKFAALAETFTGFKIDYFSSKGAIRFYYPDFVAVERTDKGETNWIIETKGREYEDTDRKDAAMKKWCEDISKETGQNWMYLKVPQFDFEAYPYKSFRVLVEYLEGLKKSKSVSLK